MESRESILCPGLNGAEVQIKRPRKAEGDPKRYGRDEMDTAKVQGLD
jgi:hypothetical protein